MHNSVLLDQKSKKEPILSDPIDEYFTDDDRQSGSHLKFDNAYTLEQKARLKNHPMQSTGKLTQMVQHKYARSVHGSRSAKKHKFENDKSG